MSNRISVIGHISLFLLYVVPDNPAMWNVRNQLMSIYPDWLFSRSVCWGNVINRGVIIQNFGEWIRAYIKRWSHKSLYLLFVKLVFQGPFSTWASNSPGHGGIVHMMNLRCVFPVFLNWNLVFLGIVRDMPGSTLTVSSMFPCCLQTKPVPWVKNHISSTFLCEIGLEVKPAGSVHSLKPPPFISWNSLISEPSGAFTWFEPIRPVWNLVNIFRQAYWAMYY